MSKRAMVLAVSILSGLHWSASAEIKVLTVAGDWKAQAWYQDVWQKKGSGPTLERGRLIASEVAKAAPGKFEFTDITNYAGQEYLDATYLAQFDVVLLGDIVAWSLNPRFMAAVDDYVRNGGGLIYCASWKWSISMLGRTPFGGVLPIGFPADSLDDWNGVDVMNEKAPFVPQVAQPEHPAVRGLDWGAAPALERNFTMLPKEEAEVLVKSPGGSPVLVAWQLGKGRTMTTGSIFAADETEGISGKFAEWKDFGKFYAQVFGWLGEHSPRKAKALADKVGEVGVKVDFTKTLNRVPNGIFSVHGHDSAGFPLTGQAYTNFMALNPTGGFARFDLQLPRKNGVFDFEPADRQLGEIRRLGLRPIVLFSGLAGGQHPAWADGSSWKNPSEAAIEVVKEEVAAFLEHANGGRGGAAGYKTEVEFIELLNEPHLNYQGIPGFARLFNAVADFVHKEFPGVKVGAFGFYEIPYLKAFIDACGAKADWISRHPYGWTGEMVFRAQDEFAAYAAEKGYGHLKFIITEWDFWIQGRQKFDYMVKRNFEAVRRENLLGALHYRLGMYNEPIYLFGLLWGGWGQDAGAGAPNTPMHDAYDAFWIFRDFRGERVAVQKSGTGMEDTLLPHVLAEGTRDGEKLNLVLYYDWAYGGAGVIVPAADVRYPAVKASIELAFPAADKARTLTLSKATGEGFEMVQQRITIAARATAHTLKLDIAPVTAWSLTIQ